MEKQNTQSHFSRNKLHPLRVCFYHTKEFYDHQFEFEVPKQIHIVSDSLTPIIAALVDLAIIRSSLIFGNRLSILRWIKYKPPDLKISNSFKHCSLC